MGEGEGMSGEAGWRGDPVIGIDPSGELTSALAGGRIVWGE